MTCLTRAASFFKTILCLKSEDYIAPLLVSALIKPLLKMGLIRKFYGEGKFLI